MTNAEMKARELISNQTTENIVRQFELTDIVNDANIYTVRGWYMEELEKRNPKAFEDWVMSEDDSPRKYFITKESA